MKIAINNYSFNKTTKQITFNDFGSITLPQVLTVINTTNNTILYSPIDATLGGSVSTNVLTLNRDTSAMNNTDALLIFYEDLNRGLTDTQLRASPLNVLSTPSSMVTTNYNQSGVIAINTILMSLDCLNARSVSFQITSMGTSGVITPEFSNDNTNWIGATMFAPTGLTGTTMNTGLWVTPVIARYFRLRLNTATTAGTTNVSCNRIDEDFSPWLSSQPVSGTIAVSSITTLPTLPAGTNTIGGIFFQPSSLAVDITSSTLTTTSTSGSISLAFGSSYSTNIVVSAVGGTTPTLDLSIEESDDNGTNWYKVYDFPRITATGIYRSPKITVRGARIRYVQTVTGTSPSFTRVVNRLQTNDTAKQIVQLIDRTIVPNTLNSTSQTLYVEGCNNFNFTINCSAQTTAATVTPQFSIDGTNWFNSTPITTALGIVQAKVSNEQWRFVRFNVTTAGTGVVLNTAEIRGIN